MACLHPLKAWRYLDGVEFVGKKLHFFNQDMERDNFLNSDFVEYLEVPCGKCFQCRLQYSRNWADRCMLEAQEYEHNEFVTLTYAPEHLPLNRDVVTPDGECVATLQPKDLTDFMKRLRQAFARGEYTVTHDDGKKELIQFPINENIRFFACGEYGDQYQRPHYHLIIFNIDVPDKKFWKKNKQGSLNYTSDLIKSIWNKGIVSLCPVTWETCAYTARYVVKKQKGKDSAEYYASRGIVPEFVRMSRRPGIARKYFDDHMHKIYEYDALWLKKGDRVEKIKPSRYYDSLFDIVDPEKLLDIKEKRKQVGQSCHDNKMSRTSLSDSEYLAKQEKITSEIVTKQLNRNYENGSI